MKPGHSILLINENMLDESNVSLYSASTNLLMMAGFSSLERTQSQFTALLSNVGLDLVKVWRPGSGETGIGTVLEVVCKDL